MAEGRTYNTLRFEKRKRRWFPLLCYLFGLWLPYWLWSENKMAEVAKPALREYFKNHCGEGLMGVESLKRDVLNPELSNRTDEQLAVCANQEIQYISANIGLFRSTAAYWVAPGRDQPEKRRYFRIQLNFHDWSWDVVEEIAPSSYNFAL